MNITDERLIEIYGEALESRSRYLQMEEKFHKEFGIPGYEFFSAPGRTEIIGNHTDHNGGKIIAGSVSMDTIAVAAVNNSDCIEIISEGYPEKIVLDINSKLPESEREGTKGLIAGMVEAIQQAGYKVFGFSAYVSTNVIAASGVSSSASFEMLICSIINYFFNNEKMSYIEYAKMGQYAENKYWNKASGLMDQLACAVGGIIKLDFSQGISYEKVPFDLQEFKYKFILVNSKMDHAALNDEYSAIPNEMYEVASVLGCEKLGETSAEALLEQFVTLRKTVKNDRAIMRALHFFNENERVEDMYAAMVNKDEQKILKLIKQSGASSWKYLQNCYVPGNCEEQSVALNLALSEMINGELNAVCRVHGGGFSGVILEVVPEENAGKYIDYMSKLVGEDNIYPFHIRALGAIHV